MQKTTLFKVILLGLVCALLVLFCVLIFVPITHDIEYTMHGYVVHTDGRILERFDFTITGKQYDFIIDRPNGAVGFSGGELTRIERDAYILYFDWGLDALAEKCRYGAFWGDPHIAYDDLILGSLSFILADTNTPRFANAILDLSSGTFCMDADELLDSCYVVGTTDLSTTPESVVEAYQKLYTLPEK